ncbi:MAG: mechanosensitive ion channel family protein [Bacteroidales bacterium]|nr:mechanosensitive ion channel family protein [Bacteroidales bacterium]
MNKEKIENSHIIDAVSGNFVDIEVEYDTDLEKAKRIITEVILSHPNVIDMRSEEDKKNKVPQVNIFLKEFTTNGICLRTTVWTDNIDSNFQTCSDIRLFFASTFWTKLQNIFGHCCMSKLDKVAKRWPVVLRLAI